MTASAERKSSRLVRWRRIAGLVGLFITVAPIHILSRWLLGRSPWPSRFLSAAARICGLRIQVEGPAVRPQSLVIANHTSWLDIMLLGGQLGAAFVSKAEVQRTILIGWLADQNRTLYIDRAARRDSHEQVRGITQALAGPQPLAVFPEGTTGDGRHLLPFRPTLLEAVAPPPSDVEVRPVAIDYGENVDVVGWHSGEGGMANVKRVLGHRGAIDVTIRLLPALPAIDDRKALARRARHAIGAALSSVRDPTSL